MQPATRWLAPAVCLLAVLAAAPLPAADKRPNVLVIMADDLGYECLSCNGSTSYRTPHLDALAKTGVRFEHCYCAPLCSPSRVQLMTGRYGFRTGWTSLIDGPKEFLDPAREKTFGEIFRAAGYATGFAGKWQLCAFDLHPDHLRACGFDESCAWAWVYKGKQTSRYWNPVIWQNGKLREDTAGKYGPDLYCDFLIDFIRKNRSRPFFAYYPMTLVHSPFEAPPDTKGQKAGKNGNFPAMVAYMDKLVGKLLATLDELGLRDNTLVLFTGDNGTPRGIVSHLGDRVIEGGKGTMTEAGTHVPLIVSGPGVVPGRVSTDLVDFSDVLPTLADLTGVALPKGVTLDGRSFAPQLGGQPGQPREWVFCQLGQARFVRDRRWRLHHDGRLFDLHNDPQEKTPVAAGSSAEADAARKRLQAALDNLRK
jgi:arylsulfatase A